MSTHAEITKQVKSTNAGLLEVDCGMQAIS